MKLFKPKDFIAVFVIIGYFAIRIAGADSNIDPALFLILGYYFVKRRNGEDNGH